MKTHQTYIKRCIQLAENGLGRTYPNPMVGSVVVHKGKIIGEGWHHKAGKSHAEVNAIRAVKNKELLKDATIYVSLEPCSHYGKTPPCSNLIIDSGIKNVVIGTVDPFSEVAGKGIQKLMKAGCRVIVGILEKQSRAVIKRFTTFHLEKRPYVILKWAQSEDGFLSPPAETGVLHKREPVWISNRYSRQLVHKWRAEEQAILVGTNTAVADNPNLNTRLWQGPDPVRVVIDQNLRIPKDSNLFDESIKTIVICGKNACFTQRSRENLVFEKADFEQVLPYEICRILFKHQLQSVIIEGGRKTLQSFIEAGLWDEARVIKGKVLFGEGTEAPQLAGRLVSQRKVASDQLNIFIND